jgi:hypothetical protein
MNDRKRPERVAYWTLNGWLTPDNRLEHLPGLLTRHPPRALRKDTTSPLRIELLDGNGRLILTQRIPLAAYCLDTPGRLIKDVPIRAKVPFRDDTQIIRFWNGEVLVKEWRRLGCAPLLSNLTVERREGIVRLRWQATHPENAPMQYVVRFSRDGTGSFNRLSKRLDQPKYEVPERDLPGGKGWIFQVAATDGVNTSTLDSEPIDLPETPLHAEISLPLDRSQVADGQAVFFSGDLVCFLGYEESIASLEWISDRDGKLSDRISFETDGLSLGSHQITLAITYGKDRLATAQVSLQVVV